MKKLLYTYIIILILLAVLPINGTSSMLNNNYLLNIRWDYLVHALVYIPLVPMIMIAFSGWKVKPYGRAVVIIVSLLFAFSLEGIQYFIPYRAFNINDLAANGGGVGLGFFVFFNFKNI
jgi:VanZ family protein